MYDLAGQVVRHLQSYLSADETGQVLRYYEREIARLVHAQMQEQSWDDAVDYEVVVSRGFSELCPTAFSQTGDVIDFRVAPVDRSNMSRYLFGGFSRCLYPVQKFQAEQERLLAVILDREAQKWFKPVQGQFQLFYRLGADHREYQPDFVAETETAIYMLEPKRRSDMDDPEVVAKRDAAVLWCQRASDHAQSYNGKPWAYALIPHDATTENMSLNTLVARWQVTQEERRR